MNRREFLTTTVAARTTGSATSMAGAAGARKPVKILGISCSPRKGKTTAAALALCLEAAGAVPGVTTELIELAGRNIGVYDPANPEASQGGFADLIPVLSDPNVGGIIVGTPIYMGNMTSLCKAFLDHCIVFRRQKFALGGKVGGVVAVGAGRNGGLETALHSVQASLLCQEMIVVGDGQPTSHFGAALMNDGKDSIAGDTSGIATAKNLGRHVAEVALKLAQTGT
jgi:multimeric flavodoxin WrbA